VELIEQLARENHYDDKARARLIASRDVTTLGRRMAGVVLALMLDAATLCACGHPRINAECSINGFGMGRCDFTNEGTGAGTQCVVLSVSDKRGLGAPVSSSPVCSGEIKPRETRNVAFSMDGVRRLCSASAAEAEEHTRHPWDEYCDLHTTEQH
jgi:hypothetical protein